MQLKQLNNKITESESHELALDSYVMHLNTQICATCGATERWSQIYEVWVHPTKTRTTNYRELRICHSELKRDLGITALNTKAKSVCLCAHCVQHIQPVTGHKIIASPAEWEATLKRKYSAPVAEPRVAKSTIPTSSGKPKQMIPTIDDLKL